jgi:hypothetical protein
MRKEASKMAKAVLRCGPEETKPDLQGRADYHLSAASSLNRPSQPSITFPFAGLETSHYRCDVFEHWLGKSIPPPIVTTP